MYMLDTDTCSYVLRKSPIEVLKRFDAVEPNQLCISVITKAELLYGAERKASKRLDDLLNRFLTRMHILPFPDQAALIYARKRNELERAGTPIGNMDLLIACHAIAVNCTVVTNNTRHFSRIQGLSFENWCKET